MFTLIYVNYGLTLATLLILCYIMDTHLWSLNGMHPMITITDRPANKILVLNPLCPMDSPFWFDTINLGWPIV